MEKLRLKKTIHERVDGLFLSLKRNLDISISEAIKLQFNESLYREASDAILDKRQAALEEIADMFSELEKDLCLTFSEQTKSELRGSLLVAAGFSDTGKQGKETREISPQNIASSVVPVSAQNNGNHSEAAVQACQKSKDEPEKEKLWTSECENPNIVQKVNETIIGYLRLEKNEDKITRNTHLRNDLGMDSLDQIELVMQLERIFECNIPTAVTDSVETVGDVYDAVNYILSEHYRH